MSLPAKKPLTYTDYAALPEGEPYQLIGGTLVLNPAPTPYHQRISRNLGILWQEFLRENSLGEVLFSPIDVYFSDTEVYQPDLIVVLKDRLDIIGEQKIEAPPDLVAEILSPSTGYYDLKHKKQVYERSGVKEYWVVDPMEKSVEIFALVDGAYRSLGLLREGVAASRLIAGLRVDLEKIF